MSRFFHPASTALLVVSLACTSAPAPRTSPAMPTVEIADLEERALMLLLSDRKIYEPLSINKALDGDASLRRQVAFTLARIGGQRGGPALELLLADPDPAVRRAAAFALGELGEQTYRQGAQSLFGAILDRDRETGRLAVEALAKLEVAFASVVDGFGTLSPEDLPRDEIEARLLPSLFRFQTPAGEAADEEVLAWAEAGLEAADPELHAMAAYALAREVKPRSAPLLRSLLADGDPWVRGWAARALGQVGDRFDLDRLRPLLDDPEPGPIIRALNASLRLLGEGQAAPPEDWRPRLLELVADPRPGVRMTAIEVSALWLLDEELGAELARLAEQGVQRERELAFVALAEGGDPRTAALLLEMARDRDPVLRARAAEVAGLLRSLDVLADLATDEAAGVRRTAFETRLELPSTEVLTVAAAALEDRDPGVRASALSWAAENPRLPMEVLLRALAASRRDRMADARLAAVRALAARAEAEPLERGAIIAELETFAGAGEFLVRRQAAQALADLGREAPPLGAVDDRRTVRTYREIVQRTRRPRTVEIVTERGTIAVELDCPQAPLTCLNFLQLAGQGFYEGIVFHRVVPDFVVQAGDPRGDGIGGPGYTIRDEINRVRYRRGVIGMALSGPDTGGSQFFVTLSPQPHLDGGYTAFGRVISGDEVLDLIVQGDRILRVVEVTR
ncbi:MAG: peptidylprolyl isomerase [Thermoanaerobaculia bacterium]